MTRCSRCSGRHTSMTEIRQCTNHPNRTSREPAKSDISGQGEMSDLPQMSDSGGLGQMSDLGDMSELSELSEMSDLGGLSELSDSSDLSESGDSPNPSPVTTSGQQESGLCTASSDQRAQQDSETVYRLRAEHIQGLAFKLHESSAVPFPILNIPSFTNEPRAARRRYDEYECEPGVYFDGSSFFVVSNWHNSRTVEPLTTVFEWVILDDHQHDHLCRPDRVQQDTCPEQNGEVGRRACSNMRWRLRREQRATANQASLFGRYYERCVGCGRKLTTCEAWRQAVNRGYCRDDARLWSWPWIEHD